MKDSSWLIDNPLYRESLEGVPQGGSPSPLRANIMLDPLDKELEKRGHLFARYADDFTLLVKTPRVKGDEAKRRRKSIYARANNRAYLLTVFPCHPFLTVCRNKHCLIVRLMTK